jgi:integral membrane protein
MTDTAPTRTAPDRKLLNAVLIVGVIDFVLLLVLMYFAFVDRSDAAVSVLGPIHGVGFLLLLVMTAKGANEGQWGWWFPAIVVVTGGPLGSLIGEVVLRRRAA